MSLDLISRNNIHVSGKQDAAQTIMFGHGFGTDQNSFAEVVKPFQEKYRVIVYDNVGGGKSDMNSFSPARYSSLNGYVTDLEEVFDSMQLKDVIYVGHSVNGMVSMLTSIKRPEFFKKLVLLGASPRYLNDAEAGYSGGFEQSDLNGLYEAMSGNYYAWASGFSKMVMRNEDRPQLAEHFAGTLSEIRPDIALSVARAIFESDHRADLGKCNIETLVVQTSEDVAVPESVGPYIHKGIKNSKLTKVNAKGHFPQMSAPAEVISAVKSFIE